MLLKSEFLPLIALAAVLTLPYVADGMPQTPSPAPTPTQLTSEQDHQRMMDLLHITSLRRGADGDPKSPNAANYDEAKANPYPHLPDPLVLENGSRVTNAETCGSSGARRSWNCSIVKFTDVCRTTRRK